MNVWIKGTKLPSPNMDGSNLTHPKTWTANSGRTASGKMTGRVQYYKYKLVLKWGCLSKSDYKTLRNLVETEPQWFAVKVTDGTGTTEFTGYSGDIAYEKCSVINDSEEYYMGVTVEIVER